MKEVQELINFMLQTDPNLRPNIDQVLERVDILFKD